MNSYYRLKFLKFKHFKNFQGESGMNKNTAYSDVNAAIKEFEKKFKDKTKNNWSNRDSFKPVPGKYTMIEMAGEEEDEVDVGYF